MNAPALKEREQIYNDAYLRRFEIADLNEHGAWLMPRLLQAFPNIPERTMAGFLNGQLYNAEVKWLYSKNAVGMAQVSRATTLQARPIIWEKFVFCRDPANPEHQAEALSFYEDWRNWAKFQNADTIIVAQQCDVPTDLLQKFFGRLLRTEQLFVKV